jgi:molecular chaperone DnaK
LTEGYNYRIVREDGGFDSGSKNLSARISEDLPLINDSYNFFKLTIYDSINNEVQTEMIEISQGKFTISGQPLPEDICIEVDDANSERTKLELIFKKNAILPLRKTITKDVNKTIRKGSNENLVINLLEGDGASIPQANKHIGYICVNGNDIQRDILKGSDIEITIEISESRDLIISAYVSMIDQEFKGIFSGKKRTITPHDLSADVYMLNAEIEESIEIAIEGNNQDKVNELQAIKSNLIKLDKEVSSIDDDDTTDNKYKAEDNKRTIAKEYYSLIKDEKLSLIKKEYTDLKAEVTNLIEDYGNEEEKEHFNDLIEKEAVFLNSSNIAKLNELIDEMSSLKYKMRWRDIEFVQNMYTYAISESNTFKDENRASNLKEQGNEYFDDLDELTEITHNLFQLMSSEEQRVVETKIGFF